MYTKQLIDSQQKQKLLSSIQLENLIYLYIHMFSEIY